jgi:hypothetical protein
MRRGRGGERRSWDSVEAWTFVDEKDINGGKFFDQLDFEIRSHGQG